MKKINLFILIIFILSFSSCLSKTSEYLLWQKKSIPTYHQILKDNFFNRIFGNLNIGEKAIFLAFFPLYLRELENIINQQNLKESFENNYNLNQDILKSFDINENLLSSKNKLKRLTAIEILLLNKKSRWLKFFNEEEYLFLKLTLLNDLNDNLLNNKKILKKIFSNNESNSFYKISILKKIEIYKNKSLLKRFFQSFSVNELSNIELIKLLEVLNFFINKNILNSNDLIFYRKSLKKIKNLKNVIIQRKIKKIMKNIYRRIKNGG